jgi:uncharacterized protein
VTTSRPLASALYRGWMTHQRSTPTVHRFRRPLSLTYLDLDEVDEVLSRHPLWSTGRWAPVQFRRRDYLDGGRRPLTTSVRDLVESRLGTRPAGSIRMLTHLRTFWWLFNPITLYYCFDSGDEPQALVAEVTSTPWKERHLYVMPFEDARHGDVRIGKELHVSPFMGMDQSYSFALNAPADALRVRIQTFEDDRPVFEATLGLRRHELDRRTMSRVLWHDPLHTMRVSAGIYAEAARLAAKGTPVYRHPEPAVLPRPR